MQGLFSFRYSESTVQTDRCQVKGLHAIYGAFHLNLIEFLSSKLEISAGMPRDVRYHLGKTREPYQP